MVVVVLAGLPGGAGNGRSLSAPRFDRDRLPRGKGGRWVASQGGYTQDRERA